MYYTKNKDIETFIKFLKRFYKYNDKKKNKVINLVTKSDENFGKWLKNVSNFNEYMQNELYDNLRLAVW